VKSTSLNVKAYFLPGLNNIGKDIEGGGLEIKRRARERKKEVCTGALERGVVSFGLLQIQKI